MVNFLQTALVVGVVHIKMLSLAMLSCSLSMLLVIWSMRAARGWAVLARPSDRGSHAIPTPRLGGVGAAVAVYLGAIALYAFPPDRFQPAMPGFMLAALVAGAWGLAGGTLDDVLELPPRWKFLFQGAAAASVVALGLVVVPPVAGLPAWAAAHPAAGWCLGAAFSAAVVVFWMNAYNFMDGMDGQASWWAALVCLGLAAPLLATDARTTALAALPMVMAGALLGLLMFNYPGKPAGEKTFMGDSGSQFFGALLAVLWLRLALGGPSTGGRRPVSFPASAFAAMLAPFAYDVVFTLIRRLLRGENVLKAHRSHLYQRLMVAGWTHGQVLTLNTALWTACIALGWMDAAAAMRTGEAVKGAAADRILAWCGVAFALVLYTGLVMRVEASARAAARDGRGVVG